VKSYLSIVVALGVLLGTKVSSLADGFDRHTNPILQQGLNSPNVQEVHSLTSELAFQNDRALPGVVGTFLIVRTNEGRNAKLLVQWARQKSGDGKSIPMILIDRYTCYREGEERAIHATGQNLSFFPGFRLSLDIGQLVPPELAADLACKTQDGGAVLEPVGRARLFVVRNSLLPKTAPLGALPKPGDGPFDPKYFAGTFKLNDDGRRMGTLELQVKDGGDIVGAYYSDGTGQKYEVTGKIGSPKNTVQFTIRFPRTEQTYHGWLFTGDARGLTGYSTMQERESGFYAVRVEEK
jgi:hypothetical protein